MKLTLTGNESAGQLTAISNFCKELAEVEASREPSPLEVFTHGGGWRKDSVTFTDTADEIEERLAEEEERLYEKTGALKEETDHAKDALLKAEDEGKIPALINRQAEIVPAPAADKGFDHKGVAFNPEFCAKAKEPFYQSGKKMGQWKKRQGIDETAYDGWYASQLTTDDTTADEPVSTAEAFSNDESKPSVDDDTPQDAGQFMVWVSQQQNAGNITQADIDAAWKTCGLSGAPDLFPPNDAETVRQRVGQLYSALVVAGAQ